MSWQQVTCQTTASHQESVVETMEAAGVLSITWQDAEDDPILEPLPGEMRLWSRLVVTGLYEQSADLAALLLTLESQRTRWQISDLSCEILEDQAWERAWMDNYKPMCFGKRLWIYPGGYTLPDDNTVKLLLDPGLAFGTGTHPTTALCLEWLDAHDMNARQVLDYGCGSGILAIAALRLGAQSAIATDIDPQALQATRDNAARNGIRAAALHTCFPHELPNQTHDVVMANILAGPLVQLASVLLDALRPGGHLVLSGILAEQLPDIVQAYAPALHTLEHVRQNDWVRVSGIRH